MEVTSTKPVPVATVKRILEKRVDSGEELGYEQAQALEHAKAFVKMEEKAAARLIAELAELPKMSLETSIKIVDVMPAKTTTLKAILSKDKIELNEEELARLMDCISKAR